MLQTTKQNISSEGSVIKKTNAEMLNLTSGKFWGLLSTFSKNGNFDINIKEQKDTEIHEALCKNWQAISSPVQTMVRLQTVPYHFLLKITYFRVQLMLIHFYSETLSFYL